jgi:choline dehydrogenase-like flavoprotein
LQRRQQTIVARLSDGRDRGKKRMIADSATVPDGEVIEGDVCVVGAGAAGLTLARELGAAGVEVVLLERGPDGGQPPSPDTAVNVGIPYDLETSRSFELAGAVQRWRVNTPLGRGFGRLRELEPIDFERRDWIPHSGWPFGKDVLQPFYARARALFEWSWPSDDPEQSWDQDLHTGPFAADSALTTRVFSFGNPGVFPGRVWRSIKNSAHVLALTGAVVTELRCARSPSHVSSVVVRTANDATLRIEAATYVLAAGGIETPRLLLASRHRHAAGLANAHDLVGRFFMEHPHYASGRLVPASRDAFADPAHFAIHLHEGIPVQKKYTLPEAVVRREELLGATFRFEAKPRSDSDFTLRYSERAMTSIEAATVLARAALRRERPPRTLAALATTVRGSPHVVRYAVNRGRVRIGQATKRRPYTEPQAFWIRAMSEQAPNPASRLRLLRQHDRFGVPIVALDWRLAEQDRRSMLRSQELLEEALTPVGHRVESLLGARRLPPALSGGMHHMGTTRMAGSPRRGVVDEHGRVHDVDNLYVAGSSVFPTGGYANPTLTILALSLRLADHLRSIAGRG